MTRLRRVAKVVLFHSIYGLRPAVTEAAERFRAAGHTVTTPDLFGGTVFDDLAEARRCRDGLGLPDFSPRAAALLWARAIEFLARAAD
jgi:Dienelactone hydrolase family